jgi:hypothetical protein
MPVPGCQYLDASTWAVIPVPGLRRLFLGNMDSSNRFSCTRKSRTFQLLALKIHGNPRPRAGLKRCSSKNHALAAGAAAGGGDQANS